MSITSIFAFLSLLSAFNVDQATINTIHDILIPVEASTTPVIISPVTINPIQQDAPLYFGGAPVITNPQPTQSQPVMEDKSGVSITDVSNLHPGWATYVASHPGTRYINITVNDTNGNIVVDPAKTFTLTIDGVKYQAGSQNDQPVYDVQLNDTNGKTLQLQAGNNATFTVLYQGTVYSDTL